MKRIATILIAVAGIGAGLAGAANWYLQRTGVATQPILAHVPADTPFYFGYSKPVPASERWRQWQRHSATASIATQPLDPARLTADFGAAAGVLGALYLELLEATAGDAEHPLTRIGLAASAINAAYAVGAQPVLRIALADRDAFWAAVDRAETRAGATGTATEIEGMPLRRYPFQGELDAELVLATAGGYAVATVALSGVTDDSLRLALGFDLPETSLAESDTLTAMAQRHGTLEWATGFVDHEIITAALSGDQGTRLGRMLAALRTRTGNAAVDPDSACARDARAIAALWPRTVLGVTELDPETGRVAGKLTVVGTDAALLDTLGRLRGHVPSSIGSGALGGVGIGLNVSELVPVLQTLAARLVAAEWDCPALRELQARFNPGALGQLALVSAFAGDVRGIGLALDALSLEGDSAPVMEGQLEIVTPRPQVLWQMLTSLLPAPPVQPPVPGGPAVPLAAPVPVEVPLRVALREHSIVILAGAGTVADAAADADDNALFGVFYRYQALADALDRWLAQSGETLTPEQRQALEAMASGAPPLSYHTRLDVTDTGIVMDLVVTPSGATD
jgi:hypothetical protein